MRTDKLTSAYQTVLQEAQSLAVQKGHQMMEPAHVMLAMLQHQGSGIYNIYATAGVDVSKLLSECNSLLDSLPQVSGAAGEVHVSSSLGGLLNLSEKIAHDWGDEYIACETFALAALEDKGKLGDLLRQLGADKSKIQTSIQQLRQGQTVFFFF